MQTCTVNFFNLLCEGKGKRKKFDCINEAHLKAFPQYRNNSEQASHLWRVLTELVDSGQLLLPAQNGKSWRPGNPKLPLWVSVITIEKSAKPLIPEKYAWHPKIASFIEDLKASQKTAAFKISEYLKQHTSRGNFEISIPRRERSLKIFGDEKKLDQLANKGFLLSGNLRLSDIGCHDVGWPMPHKLPSIFCAGKPFLIVENHHTYDSFCRWNEVENHYAGIGYGAGEAFSTVETDHIDNIIDPTEANSIHYFGDIDPKGVSIPARVNKGRIDRGLSPIVPATTLYQWLLDNGIPRDFTKKNQPSFPENWFLEPQSDQIKTLFSQKIWLPQEALGYEELLSKAVSP